MYSTPPELYARPQNNAMVGKVLGLLSFSMVFTAGGALLAPRVNVSLGLISIISFITLLIVMWARSLASPIRLGLLYGFCVLEGLFLGTVINAYTAAGRGSIVVMAAGVTGGLVLILSGYAWVTKTDFRGLGSYLFAGLIAVILASIVGIFVQATLFHLIVSSVTAMLFSGYILYDIQRLRNASINDDAIGLACNIYLDILNLFWSILRIFSILSDD